MAAKSRSWGGGRKVGASYTSDNSVSTFSGLPAILGPTNHESQWRGGYAEIGSREDEVRQIYESRSWVTAKELIDRYAVRYIFIGSAERSAYELQEQKFQTNLALVFESGNCRIYQVYSKEELKGKYERSRQKVISK